MTDKGFNNFDKYAPRCAHLFPQDKKKSASRLPEGILKCTHLAA